LKRYGKAEKQSEVQILAKSKVQNGHTDMINLYIIEVRNQQSRITEPKKIPTSRSQQGKGNFPILILMEFYTRPINNELNYVV
jgi:hypothetical protein